MAAEQLDTKISTASLYVGDLAPNITETTLFEIFNKIGPLQSIRVCRDKQTRKSLGYAYVNYTSVKDAERALGTLNYTNIRGKSCRIMWSQRNPQLRKSHKGSIFVKHLHKSIDNKMFHDMFSIYGNILSCKLVLNEKLKKLYNYGYVQFSNEQSAHNAIQQLNGTMIHDQKVHVAIFEPRQERLQKASFTNIYVKHIPASFDESILKNLFESETNGKITSMQFWKRDFGISACLNFETHEQAKLAIETFNGRPMKDCIDDTSQTLYVARAEKRKIRKQELNKQRKQTKRVRKTPEGANLYIKNLSDGIDNKKLKELFQRFGTIRSVRVMRNSDGTSKGFGFVAYETKQSAMNAIHQMIHVFIDGKPLYVSFAQKQEVRKKYLDKKIGNRLKCNHENISNTMNLLRYQIDNVLTPKLKELKGKILFGQVFQWNITNQQYWTGLEQQRLTITEQIKAYRLQYKQCEISLIQLQHQDASRELLASQLENDSSDNADMNNNEGMVGEAEGKIENEWDDEKLQMEKLQLQKEENKSDENTIQDDNIDRCKLKFGLWLNNIVNLPNYLKLFEENEYDDISMVEFFDEDTIENELGIKKKIHSKLILKRVNEFKKSMNEFDKIIESNTILKQYKQMLMKNGILTVMDLKIDIKTKEDVINILHIDRNREQEIKTILSVICNAK